MRQNLTRRIVGSFLICVGILLVLSPISLAQVPGLINFQGQLTDELGNPVADGTYLLGLAIYSAPEGGSPLWASERMVTAVNSVFQCRLGEAVPLPGDLFAGSDNRYLGITIGENPESSPRLRFTSSPYAFQSLRSDTAGYAWAGPGGGSLWSQSGSNVYYNAGNVGIGTDSPTAKLSFGTDLFTPYKIALWDAPEDFYGFGLTLGRITAHAGDIECMTWTNNGNVGIGTPGPDVNLVVQGREGETAIVKIDQFGAGQYAGWRLDRANIEKWFMGMSHVNDNFLIRRSAAHNDFVISTSGNVGIGTPDPGTAKFAVMGGNVGIGTTAPDNTFHVNGYSRFQMPSGNIYVTTPGGWPGFIAFSTNGHRRDIFVDNDKMFLLVSNSSAAPNVGSGITIANTGYVGIGHSSPQERLHVNGNVKCNVIKITGGADIAEPFDVGLTEGVQPGTVMSIDPAAPGKLRVADQAYDRCVAGIVSGAGGISPGMVLEQEGTGAEGEFPIAMTGRVYCLADASFGAIQPGDLLTTSGTAGHAMRVTDYPSAQGAVIGKAMTALEDGCGLVLVLVALQ